MNTKILCSIICTTMMLSGAFAKNTPDTKRNAPHNDGFEMTMLMNAPKPMHRPPFMEPGITMGPGPMEHLNLTDKQRQDLTALGKKHRDDMKSLHKSRDALREKYLEKFEAILTDEQFRKIETMRKDLRREMKRLNEKQENLIENNRDKFESILTDEQKQQLRKMPFGNMNNNTHPDASDD